jgi:hypothetical protein
MTDGGLDRFVANALVERKLIGVSVATVAGDTTVATSSAGPGDLARARQCRSKLRATGSR